MMLRIELDGYGRLTEREGKRPTPGDGEVLVRVVAASVNAADWYEFAGRPFLARPLMGLRRPKSPRIGRDFAGIVEGVGAGETGLAVGDEVYGWDDCAYAEYLVAGEVVLPKPARLTLEEAAAAPLAGLSALQGLRDHAGVGPGMRVLVNGASGGVGTFAVQIAVALGAEVHAVCSSRNVDQARALGASRVFDYTREDFSRSGERYDVIFDVAGNRSWRAMCRVLTPAGLVMLVGGPKRNRLLGPLGHVGRILVAARFAQQRAAFFIAKPNRADLHVLSELIDSGEVTPVVERTFTFDELGDALAAMREGHARAKLVVSRAA